MVSLFAAVFLGILLGVTLLIFTGVYTSLLGVKKQIDRNWSVIESSFLQRDEAIVLLVKFLYKHLPREKALLEKLGELRKKSQKCNALEHKIKVTNELTYIVSSLLLLDEAYPHLRSNPEYRLHRANIDQIDKQIKNRLEHFNKTIEVFNERSAQFPDMFFAQALGFSPLEQLILHQEEERTIDTSFRLAA